MALSVASLTHGSDLSSVPTIFTASVSPGANNYEVFAILSNNAIPTGLSISGNGLTWTQLYTDSNQGANRAVNIWAALGTPSAGSITISNPNNIWVMWDYLEVSGGVDTTGSALRQTAAAFGGSPLDAGMAATLATSALIGIIGDRDASATLTAGSGYTLLNNFVDTGGGLIGRLGTEWNIGVTSGACGWNFDSPAAVVIYGLEVQTPVTPPPPADTFVAAWGMQPPIINRGLPTMVASGSRPGTRVS